MFYDYCTLLKGILRLLQLRQGACCSPSSAQFVENLNAERFKAEHPEAVKVIQKRHYVDDMLVSVDSEDEAIQLAHQVKRCIRRADSRFATGLAIPNASSNHTKEKKP